MVTEPVFLEDTVLNDSQNGCAGAHGRVFCGGFKRGERDLLDFERDDIGAAGEIGGGAGIVPVALEAGIDDEARRAGGIGVHDLYAVSEGAGGHGGHATELASAENADGCAGHEDAGRGGA